MMPIDSLNATMSSAMMPPPMRGARPLTDDQRSQLQDILANYDPENMTAEDTRTMRDEIRATGIRPGRELKSALEEAGFEVGPPPDGPPGQMAGPMGLNRPEPPQFILDFIDKSESGDITADEVTEFLEAIQARNQETTGLLIDQQY